MIPIQNIYYMLSYAFQTLQAENYKDLAAENFHNTAELCAEILDKGIGIQLKHGLRRDYVSKSESLSTLQGLSLIHIFSATFTISFLSSPIQGRNTGIWHTSFVT